MKFKLVFLAFFFIFVLTLPRVVALKLPCLNPLNSAAVEYAECNIVYASNVYLFFGILGITLFLLGFAMKSKLNNKKTFLFLGIMLIAIFSVSYYRFLDFAEVKTLETDVFLDTFYENSKEVVDKNVNLQTDFTGAKITKEELISGCRGKDCIPSIDNPKFENVNEADKWLNDSDRMFTVEYKGESRAYAQRIMNWHEIVNDEIAGDKIAVTFCPLCGSALAFIREVDGIVTEFGVSGKLHNNDLVMYDRYEGNLWQQITGEAIVGPAARRNEQLEKISVFAVEWGEWKTENPEGLVLSRVTGHFRDYSAYPYGTYEEDDRLLFGIKNLDKSLQIKTPVYGVEIREGSKAYPESIFETNSKISDSINGVKITLEREKDGDISVTRLDTKKEIVPIRLFWFAWAAFHPDTEIYTK